MRLRSRRVWLLSSEMLGDLSVFLRRERVPRIILRAVPRIIVVNDVVGEVYPFAKEHVSPSKSYIAVARGQTIYNLALVHPPGFVAAGLLTAGWFFLIPPRTSLRRAALALRLHGFWEVF